MLLVTRVIEFDAQLANFRTDGSIARKKCSDPEIGHFAPTDVEFRHIEIARGENRLPFGIGERIECRRIYGRRLRKIVRGISVKIKVCVLSVRCIRRHNRSQRLEAMPSDRIVADLDGLIEVDPKRSHGVITATSRKVGWSQRSTGVNPQIAFSVEQQSGDGPLISDGCADIVDAVPDLESQHSLRRIVANIDSIAYCSNPHRLRQMRIFHNERLALRIQNRLAIGVENIDGRGCPFNDKSPNHAVVFANRNIRRYRQQARSLNVLPENRSPLPDRIELLYTLVAVIHDIDVARGIAGEGPRRVELTRLRSRLIGARVGLAPDFD